MSTFEKVLYIASVGCAFAAIGIGMVYDDESDLIIIGLLILVLAEIRSNFELQKSIDKEGE